MPEIHPTKDHQSLYEKSFELKKQAESEAQSDMFKVMVPWEDLPIAEVCRDEGVKLYGSGDDNFVVEHPGSSEKVIAYTDRESNKDMLGVKPYKAHELYYIHDIMKTLFPHNFPKVYAVSGGEQPGTVKEKITQDDQEIHFPLSEVMEVIKTCKLPVDFDAGKENNTMKSQGGEYYVDNLIIHNHNHAFSEFRAQDVLAYMDSKEDYTLDQKVAIITDLNRLAEFRVISHFISKDLKVDRENKMLLQQEISTMTGVKELTADNLKMWIDSQKLNPQEREQLEHSIKQSAFSLQRISRLVELGMQMKEQYKASLVA